MAHCQSVLEDEVVGMDYVGPISPPRKKAEYKYILMVVDYFSRFVFAKGFAEANQMSTLVMFFEVIVPIFGGGHCWCTAVMAFILWRLARFLLVLRYLTQVQWG